MVSLSTVSTETDIVGLTRPDSVIIPSSHFEIPIGSLTVSHSKGCHIGPKIVAESVTYINEENNNKRKKRLTNNIMIILIATLLITILILLVIKNKSDIDNSGKKLLPDSSTTSLPTVDTTTNTPWTPTNRTTLPPTIVPPIPDVWMIPYYNWSLQKNIPCIKSIPSYTISLETITSPNCQDSKDYLITYESTKTLKHNFYIDGDGLVFEGYGWYCSAEYNYRYSRSVIKVAFFCLSNLSYISSLQKLISYGLNNTLLHNDYNILPECCRYTNISNIDNETMIFLQRVKGMTFRNPSCIGYNPQCNILT